MSNYPIKNGVNIWFPQYHAWCRGDIYKVGTAYVFVCTGLTNGDEPRDFDVEVTISQYCVDRILHEAWRILIIPPENCNFLNKEIMEYQIV